jgi:hypothetical protein
MNTPEKKQIIEAIGELGRNVTAADVSTKTGLPVLTVAQNLNQVAAETGGHMLVNSNGNIAYKFNPGFSNAYLARGIKLSIQKTFEVLERFFIYLLKISFGIMLILSLVIVGILIVVIILRGGRSNDRDRGYGDGGFHFGFFDWLIIRDLLYWGSYNTYDRSIDYSRPSTARRHKSNFLLNCFSFLFGDGNPNYGLEEKQWQVIAEVIKKNNNVLTAEQIAPYTGADSSNEDAVLPVLVRFNGRPEVSESGNIIYVFESMQSTMSNLNPNPPSYLKEFPWQFTIVPQEDLIPVYIVAALNFFGSWWLWFYCQNQGLEKLSTLIAILVVYGTAFFTVPIVRTFFNSIRNKKIESRNNKRKENANLLVKPTDKLVKKLNEASQYKISQEKFDINKIAYTTEKDALDQPDDLDEKFREQLERNFDASP